MLARTKVDKHHRCENLLGPYTLGALAPDEQQELERHFAGCFDCREEAEELRWVHHILRGTLMIPPPPGLKARVLEGLSRWNGQNR